MERQDDRDDRGRDTPDYRRLPADVKVSDTISTVDVRPAPDPEAGRNGDHHRALRDD